MNKRKTSTVASIVKDSDMVFEDEDDESVTGDAGDSTKGSVGSASREVSRVSGRAKKTKAIFDPSDNNGPVHKRKKEALEAEKVKSLQAKATKPIQKLIKSPVQSPKKSAAIAAAFPVSPVKATKVDPKVQEVQKKKPVPVASSDVKRSLVDTQPGSPTKSIVSTMSIIKEPSKRIQARKHFKSTSELESFGKKQRPSTSSIGHLSSDYDKASTVDLKDEEIPDVSSWSYQQVSQYFNTALGFNLRDSSIFTEQEIDGVALKIMKRSDIVTTKFESLKLGTALKMWSHIIKFQTGKNVKIIRCYQLSNKNIILGSSDPTQAWK